MEHCESSKNRSSICDLVCNLQGVPAFWSQENMGYLARPEGIFPATGESASMR
jgi:hypothetical protein